MPTAFARLCRVVCTVAVAAGVAIVPTGSAAAQEPTSPSERAPLPVPHTFFSGADNAIRDPGSPLAGANDWSCRPDEQKPNPVVLAHGTFGADSTNWATFGPLLHNEGYCVFSLTYGNYPEQPWPLDHVGGLRSIPDHSIPQVADFTRRVLDATGAENVDFVGHSQGTLVSAAVAKHHLPHRVDKVVSLAPVWNGTGGDLVDRMRDQQGSAGSVETMSAGPVESIPQLLTGSDFLSDLRGETGTPYAPGISYTNIVTRHDEIVLPYTSGLLEAPDLPGYDVVNTVVQDGCGENFADHLSIVGEPRSADLVVGALDPENAPIPRCELVVPAHGPVGGPSSGS